MRLKPPFPAKDTRLTMCWSNEKEVFTSSARIDFFTWGAYFDNWIVEIKKLNFMKVEKGAEMIGLTK